MVVCLPLLLAKGIAAARERTLFAAVMAVVVDAWNESGILRPPDTRLQFGIHRTKALQELRVLNRQFQAESVEQTPDHRVAVTRSRTSYSMQSAPPAARDRR